MSYMYGVEELTYIANVCKMLEELGEPPDKTYLEVRYVAYEDTIGQFGDELGDWRYMEINEGKQ